MAIARGFIALFIFIGVNTAIAIAMPTTQSTKIFPNMAVLLRGDDYSFNHSESMADVIRSRLDSNDLAKRISSANVQACYTPSCTDCRTVFDGSFTSNSACIAAINTACLIITDLENANVQYWNHAACNGANTVHRGCGTMSVFQGAPGTNSLGVHTDC